MRPVNIFFPPETIRQAQHLLSGSGDPAGLAPASVFLTLEGGLEVRASLAPQPDGAVVATADLRDPHTQTSKTETVRIEPGSSPLAIVTAHAPDGQALDIAFCTSDVTIEVPAAQADDAEALLDGTESDNSKSGTQLLKLTGAFGGGYEADITLVQSGEDEEPWIDASLFLDGDEVMTLEPCEGPLLEDYPFEHNGRTFTLKLIRGQDAAPARPTSKPRRPGAHGTWI